MKVLVGPSELVNGLKVWGAWIVLFLVLELPAHFKWVPWPTLSRTAWDAESAWAPASLVFEAFLIVLLLHIVFRLSAAALIAVVLAAGLALGSHFAWGTP